LYDISLLHRFEKRKQAHIAAGTTASDSDCEVHGLKERLPSTRYAHQLKENTRRCFGFVISLYFCLRGDVRSTTVQLIARAGEIVALTAIAPSSLVFHPPAHSPYQCLAAFQNLPSYRWEYPCSTRDAALACQW
jgi:hypothetical protein